MDLENVSNLGTIIASDAFNLSAIYDDLAL